MTVWECAKMSVFVAIHPCQRGIFCSFLRKETRLQKRKVNQQNLMVGAYNYRIPSQLLSHTCQLASGPVCPAHLSEATFSLKGMEKSFFLFLSFVTCLGLMVRVHVAAEATCPTQSLLSLYSSCALQPSSQDYRLPAHQTVFKTVKTL